MRTGRLLTMAILAVFIICAVSVTAFAAKGQKKGPESDMAYEKANENASFKSKAKAAGETAVKYPVKLVEESVNVVGNAAKGSVDTVAGTVEATGETLTGDVEKAPDIVKKPVKGTAKTVGEAVVGTVEAPVKAGEEAAK